MIPWNIGGSEVKDMEREIVAALAIGDLTHSKLKSAIPERGTRSPMSDEAFDSLLTTVFLLFRLLDWILNVAAMEDFSEGLCGEIITASVRLYNFFCLTSPPSFPFRPSTPFIALPLFFF